MRDQNRRRLKSRRIVLNRNGAAPFTFQIVSQLQNHVARTENLDRTKRLKNLRDSKAWQVPQTTDASFQELIAHRIVRELLNGQLIPKKNECGLH